MGSTLGCGRQGTYGVRVRVGSLVVYDLPVPRLQVFNFVPIPVRVTREYSHTFTLIQNILEIKRWGWSAVVPSSSSHDIGLEGSGWRRWRVVIADGCGWTRMEVDGREWT